MNEPARRPKVPAGLQLIAAVIAATLALAVAGHGGALATAAAVVVIVVAFAAGGRALVRLADELDDGDVDYVDPVDHWGVGGWPAPSVRDIRPSRAERDQFVADVERYVADHGEGR